MGTTEAVKLDVQVQGQKSVADLKKELRDLKGEMLNVREGSEEFKRLASAAAQAQGQIDSINETIRTLKDPRNTTKAFVTLGNAAAGAFSTATGAAALFGGENENVLKTIMRLQAATNILSGIQSLTAAQRQLDLVRTTVLLKAQTVATRIGAMGWRAFWAAATLGAAVVITALVAILGNLDKIKEWLGFVPNKWEEENKKIEKSIERIRHEIKLKNLAMEDTLDLQAEEAERVFDLESRELRNAKRQAEREAKNNEYFRKRGFNWKMSTKAAEAYAEQLEKVQEAEATFLGLSSKQAERQQKEIERRREEEKKAADERKKRQEQAAADELQIARQLRDERIKAMRDENARAEAAIQARLADELAKVKGNSENAKALRLQLEENANAEIMDLRSKAAEALKARQLEDIQQASQAELEERLKWDTVNAVIIQNKLADLREADRQKKIAEIEAEHAAEMARTDLTLAEKRDLEIKRLEELTALKLLTVVDYEQAKFEIEQDFAEKSRQQELAFWDAKLEGAKRYYTSINDLSELVTNLETRRAGDNEQAQEAIRRRAFERSKAAQIGLAMIAGHQAVLAALATMPPTPDGNMGRAIAAGAMSAVQIAKIASQPYRAGGGKMGSPVSASAPVAQLPPIPRGFTVSEVDREAIRQGRTQQGDSGRGQSEDGETLVKTYMTQSDFNVENEVGRKVKGQKRK